MRTVGTPGSFLVVNKQRQSIPAVTISRSPFSPPVRIDISPEVSLELGEAAALQLLLDVARIAIGGFTLAAYAPALRMLAEEAEKARIAF